MEVNYHTLRGQFKREAGVSLVRFIAQRRVARAQELLRETDLRHCEICYLVGFPSEVTGARTFKRVAGQTMTDYREANRNLDV
jgi:AraC family transcriptional regulator of adaptative response / methylphosphotriester-DNA alkyltransferase methyltransferase